MTHWDEQCSVADVAGDTRVLSTSHDCWSSRMTCSCHFSSELPPLLVSVRNGEEVPCRSPMPLGTGACWLCLSALLRPRVQQTLPKYDPVSVQKQSYLMNFSYKEVLFLYFV